MGNHIDGHTASYNIVTCHQIPLLIHTTKSFRFVYIKSHKIWFEIWSLDHHTHTHARTTSERVWKEKWVCHPLTLGSLDCQPFLLLAAFIPSNIYMTCSEKFFHKSRFIWIPEIFSVLYLVLKLPILLFIILTLCFS